MKYFIWRLLILLTIFMLYGSPSVPDNHGGLSQEDFNRDHKEFIIKSFDLDSSENKQKKYPLYALAPAFEKYSIHRLWSAYLSQIITESGLTSKIDIEMQMAKNTAA